MVKLSAAFRSIRAGVGVLALLLLAGRGVAAQAPNFQQMTPEERTALMSRMRAAAESDRRVMMNRLGLKEPGTLVPPATDPNRPPRTSQRAGSSNWYDEAGNIFVRSGWGIWSNYDEAKAGGYPLPDPLVLKNGQRVTSAAAWWDRRRPEILNDFLTEIYGSIPAKTPKVTFEVTALDSATFLGQAIVKTVVGHIDNSAWPAAKPRIDITIYMPLNVTGRVPVITNVGGFFGQQNRLPPQVVQVLALGWGFATVNTGNIQMDSGAGLNEGIIGLVNRGQPRKPDDWGVLAAWSWGMSRALDYFETDKSLDAKRAAIQGHSRWGKTALLAGALDQRWAIVFPSCSGAMGASLEKRSWGETIDNVAGSGEYHWMAGNFLKYGGNWSAMSVDAHELIALVAPRPVFITGGTRDQWSDPRGEFLAAVAADPVYRLLGAKGLGTSAMPAPDEPLISGELAFRNHEGGHTDAPDWPVFLQFAQRYYGAPKRSAEGNAATDYRNVDLSFEDRARDLVGRMTLDEKVSQMKDVAPAIERLGVPAYNWWNEALHGVARSGLATVFPQAIGLAATWDDPLMFRTATVISDEARAKYHEYIRQDSHGRYQGLTFWSPNINLFRDPRWGRGQETYGEDPLLTGRLAVQFIRGLQGDDPKYFKTIATVKHFAVHSGPEPTRHEFDAVVSERDLRESYLPQFQMGIRDGGAYSLMCAYNRIDGKAACGSDMLLKDILRGEWNFRGYVVSDCGAIDDIYLRHKVVKTGAEASALAVKTGTDLDCGRVYYPNLIDAVKQGLITEPQIDTSVTRLFLARFKLGLFDPPERVRWAKTPFSVLDNAAHRELARQVARESMVLLKNDRGALPLRKTLRTIAVIGPNADQPRMLLGNYNGEPADAVTPLRGIREAVSKNTRVIYARGSDLAEGFPVLESVGSGVFRTPDGRPGLRVEYFNTRAMDGGPLFSGTDSTIGVNWRDGAPRAGMDPDNFGVRWTGTLRASHTGSYRLGLIGTMKFVLMVDDSVVLRSMYPTHDGEFPDPRTAQSPPLRLERGRSYRLRVDAQESYGDAQLQLIWSTPKEPLEAEALKAAQKADAVVLFLGLTARLEGEEMPIQIDGFRGGDRTGIDLPAPQQRLLERVMAVGKPTVLVLLSGSALAVNWAQDNVPAILEAWYPGQAGGTAIADVLFGDYNPAGRLPVTFYKKVSDIPAFDDYRMAGRTYRFFDGTPLYSFGHGLSYATFRYTNVRVSASTLAASDTITVSADITNSGNRAGDEVVQLYVRHLGSKVARPKRDLRGYQRITLAPGQTKTVAFKLPASSLAYWDENANRWVIEEDSVEIEIGASSSDIRLRKTIRVARPK